MIETSIDGDSDKIHIRARGLHKHYKLGETTVKALDDVDIEINKGEMIIVVGPSGSGKSTLVNMLGGVDRPDSGLVRINKFELNSMNDGQLTKFRRYHVGFLFQFYSLIPTLTAQENVEMAAELVNIRGKALKNQAMEVLDAVGLKDRAKSYPSQLSGGERQRVALARALAKKPELILVDEPTGQLDSQTGKDMVSLVRETSKKYGSTVIMVTHDQTLLEYGDRVVKMQSGKIINS